MKSHGVTIQTKPLQQYFHMVLFIYYVVLTFESVDEILWCYHSSVTSSAVLSQLFCFLHFTNWNLKVFGGEIWVTFGSERTLILHSDSS